MLGLRVFSQGISAALKGRSVRAAVWLYLANVVAAAVLFTSLLFYLVSTASGSLVAEDLRSGLSVEWIIDQVSTSGAGVSLSVLLLLAVILIPIHVLLSVFAAGGVIDAALRSLGLLPTEGDGFFAACGRYLGRFFAIVAIELFLLGVIAVLAGVGFTLATGWTSWLVLSIVVILIALAVSFFDLARIATVATGATVLGALREAGATIASSAGAWLSVVILNLALIGLVFGASVALQSVTNKTTGLSVLFTLVLGQVVMLVRMWVRVVSYAAQSALFGARS